MTMKKIAGAVFILGLLCSCGGSTPAPEDKTTFQTSQEWRPTLDNRADAVMVYGVGGNPGSGSGLPLEERLASWKAHGYQTHFMTGIAWGNYEDYFTGQWDGREHWDEGQVTAQGDTLWHGKNVPYIVPTLNYLEYFKERHIRRVIDAGVNDIFLEEPEFWASAGYSDAFKREWEAYYGTPWQRPDSSPEAAYMGAKLKYHLYYRALDQAFTYAKGYGRSLGREVRCYVPTHSLINYTQWQIVSPEASLASLSCVDGYIAQVWTGTSRVLNYYKGVEKERVFETAFLEYGCMVSMTAPTGRRLWLLTDPIEDRPRDWEDFRRNYQATFTAQLLYPQVGNYEIMPWPERIYERAYPVHPGSSEKARIPHAYASMMQVMTGALQQMPQAPAPAPCISVLMGNSLMFQDDSSLSGFFGLAMPVLKRGIPLGITHIENLGKPQSLEGVRLLLMTYANMKPMDAAAHEALCRWVRDGGQLLYCSTDTDPFQKVKEWWNTGENHYDSPVDHLFKLLDIPAGAPEGVYPCGKGSLCIVRREPSEFARQPSGAEDLLGTIEEVLGPLPGNGVLRQERGPYRIVAAMDETDSPKTHVEEGCLIDLYDPTLPVYRSVTVLPGTQVLLYDVQKAGKAPKILAAASRAYGEKAARRSFSFTCKGPEGTYNITRILLPAPPTAVMVGGEPCPFEWDAFSQTVFLRFPNSPDGLSVLLCW